MKERRAFTDFLWNKYPTNDITQMKQPHSWLHFVTEYIGYNVYCLPTGVVLAQNRITKSTCTLGKFIGLLYSSFIPPFPSSFNRIICILHQLINASFVFDSPPLIDDTTIYLPQLEAVVTAAAAAAAPAESVATVVVVAVALLLASLVVVSVVFSPDVAAAAAAAAVAAAAAPAVAGAGLGADGAGAAAIDGCTKKLLCKSFAPCIAT